MAFHLACPLTCRKICYCTFGHPNPSSQKSVWGIPTKDIWPSPKFLDEEKTVEVVVPCLLKDVKKNKQKITTGQGGRGEQIEEGNGSAKRPFKGRKMTLATSSVQLTPNSEGGKSKRLTVVRRSVEDANRSDRGGSVHADEGGGAQGWDRYHRHEVGVTAAESRVPLQQTECGLCSVAEVVGREREKRMLTCRSCNKKYHRKCVKKWAEFRDLFDWRDWVCGSCRSCEVCRQAGDASKLMFCKRCDEGFHIYCQQPPLKHVPKGPYLCPKHTVCHSCNSNVPGSGVSSRWFMAYTTCDACGRLFVKDKYCPVCLKVYRDSEVTPMVCCDSCEHWVHCWCDGISDDQFQEYQTDDNLRYVCAACRGDCHKVTSIEDAVHELWKRRDKTDSELRRKIRVAAGVPSPEEMQQFIPSSDDEKPPPSRSFGHTSKGQLRTPTGRFGSGDAGAFTNDSNRQEGGSVKKKIVIKSSSKVIPSNSKSVAGTPSRTKFMVSSS
jgi:hypothetical protein